MTYYKFEDNIRDNVMVRQFIAKRNEKKIQDLSQKVYSDSKLEEFYDANVGEFVVPKYVELKHIFLSTIDLTNGAKMNENEKAIVRKRIDDINARLVKGESFDSLCELNSEDKESRDRINPKTKKLDRGYLGILTRKDEVAKKQFGEDTFNLLFNLQKGKYSGVVQSEVGYHIFFCVDKKDQSIMPFDEAKPQIVNYFRLMDQDKIVKDDFAALIKELRGKASIEYYMNEFKS
jgi:parvulin-like peptidyl-prolyl isomerase